MLVFLENVIKLSPKLGHHCCNIFASREDLAKTNRAEGQLLFQGKKILRLARGCVSLCTKIQTEFFQLSLGYFETNLFFSI